MEDMSEYLLNPCRLVLKPEYMYVDVEKETDLFFVIFLDMMKM